MIKTCICTAFKKNEQEIYTIRKLCLSTVFFGQGFGAVLIKVAGGLRQLGTALAAQICGASGIRGGDGQDFQVQAAQHRVVGYDGNAMTSTFLPCPV